MFRAAHLCLVTKSDLLPYVPFDTARAIANAKSVNPALECLVLSVQSGAGLDAWLDWLEHASAAPLSRPAAMHNEARA
jgi:hydrogenase nickel incorporation protein HypB